MADTYLTKTVIEPQNCLEIGGRLALESYPGLRAFLDANVSPEAAALFAEPLLSFGNDAAPATVSWYADRDGEGVPFSSLDGAARSALEGVLSRLLAELRPLLDDADHGALIGAALHMQSGDDIWVLGGHPVLINWGMLPASVGRDRAGRAAHYGRTLGRYMPLSAAPPISAEDVRGRAGGGSPAAAPDDGDGVARAAAAGATGAAVGAAGKAAADAGQNDAQAATARPAAAPARSYAWVPLVLFLLLAGGTLAWLLVPGTRLFPPESPNAVTDAEALILAQSTNEALRARKEQLEAALAGAQCRADGTLLLPGGRTPEGLLPPRPGNPADGPGQRTEGITDPVLTPDPTRVVIPPAGGTGEMDQRTLVALMEERTVMVLAPNQGKVSTGTGFFVGPNLVVTNSHVVANADPANIYVTNRVLGTVHQAALLKQVRPREPGDPDFALLSIGGIDRPAFTLHRPTQTLKLQSVVAAGYPGDVLASDAAYRALIRERQVTAVPDLTVTDGSVNAEQSLSTGVDVVVHSAPISTGNSGGPLLDLCGRVVGMNTFVRQGKLRNLNFALSIGDLLDFLEGTAATPTVTTQACQPQVVRAAPPAPSTAAPATGTTPSTLTPLPGVPAAPATPAPGGLAPLPSSP